MPRDIEKLKNLTYLKISGNQIKELPKVYWEIFTNLDFHSYYYWAFQLGRSLTRFIGKTLPILLHLEYMGGLWNPKEFNQGFIGKLYQFYFNLRMVVIGIPRIYQVLMGIPSNFTFLYNSGVIPIGRITKAYGKFFNNFTFHFIFLRVN